MIRPQNKYDVFLSFRGVDTRDNFTSHLYSAFHRNHIETFIDDKLIRGDEISPSLLNAIKQSSIAVVIFSKGYASSRWCLKELVKILKCKKKYGQIVIPIFYHVDPSDVRNQTGNFGDGFSKLQERFKKRVEKLQKWRNALRTTATLSGFHSHVIGSDSVLTENIMKDIVKKLNDMSPRDFYKDLIGIESCIKEIESLLSCESIGIFGIGGIGKTTIARACLNKFSGHFDGYCYIENVRKKSEKIDGLSHLQQELFSTLLEDEIWNTDSIANFDWKFKSSRLSRKKVLIVFDDVSHFEQIESLIENLDWFVKGSLIIVTSRDKQVLKNCGVKEMYEMKELADADALKLFCRHAFKQDHPNICYEELSKKVMEYAQGVPLALKILGCLLYERSEREWESEIKKLKIIAHRDIQKVLRISYDSLDDEEQKIFLDIACFLNGADVDFVVQFLYASGFSAEIGISILVDKCLIIKSDNNMITMHNLLQEMGREIVRQESANFGKRSRLWHPDDIYEVLTYNLGSKKIQAISLDMLKVEEISFNFQTFENMRELRFLKFIGENKCNINNLGCRESSIFVKLRYLQWHNYPLKSLPSNMRIENLVLLELRNSKFEQLWNGIQNVVNLKVIDLSDSKKLTKLPDLSKARNLEKLILRGCLSLVETHSSVQYLNKLVILNLVYCKSLTSLPRRINSKSLKALFLSGCTILKRLPEISSGNIRELYCERTAIEELPSSIKHVSGQASLDFQDCKRLESLPRSLFNSKSLQFLFLSGCSNFKNFPEIPSCNLEMLDLDGTAIKELPSSMDHLSRLQSLYLGDCKSLESLPSNLFNLKSLQSLYLSGCSNLKSFPEISSCNLKELYLNETAIDELPSSIRFLSRLGTLNLRNCLMLESLPSNLCTLKSLVDLDLSGCSNLKRLPEKIGNLDSLMSLKAKRTAISEVPSSIACLNNLVELSLERFRGHEQMSFILPPSVSLVGLRSLYYLKLKDCGIMELPKSLFELSSLEDLYLNKNNFERLPESIINLSKLKRLHLSHCERLQYLPNLPNSLQFMHANHCSSLEALSGLSILFTIRTNYQSFGFRNCLKLDQNELRKIVDIALQKIHLLATTEWKRGLPLSSSDGAHKIYYPGSQIPQWLKFQSTGSSIALKLPPGDQFNDGFVGFAFCLVVAFQDHHEGDQDFKVFCELKVKSEDSDWHVVYDFPMFIARIGYVKADHVILGYEVFRKFDHGFIKHCYNNEAFFEFSVKDTSGERIKCCEVMKKCGIHLLYAQDFGESKKDRSRRFSIMNDQEERHPHKKRLKYSSG